MTTPLRVLAISGSLRAGSSNTALLRAAAGLAPPDVEVAPYAGLAGLPAFNPDRDDDGDPAVTDLRARLRAADGVLISTPEYAHGVPGALKNCLDWVVGSGELVDKPIGIIHASRSPWALSSLIETLTVMSARVIADARITVELASNRVDEAAIAGDPGLAGPIRAAVAALAAAIATRRAAPGE